MSRVLLLRLLLLAALAALVAADRSLLAARARERDSSERIGRFLPAEERDALTVAAVSVRDGEGRTWLYGRLEGAWRCLDHHLAIADGGAVQGLVDDILAAEGAVQSDDVDRAAEYGFDGSSMWQLRFHGQRVLADADRDVLLSVDLGESVPGLDGCYVRRTGSTATWAIDTDPRGRLETARPAGAPPLLDPHIVPAGFPAQGQRLQRVSLSRADGEAFALELVEVEVSEEDLMRGASPYRWRLALPDGTELEPHPMLAVSFVNFLRLAAWVAVLDPATAGAAGLAESPGRLVLEDSSGQSATLVLGPVRDGRAVVANDGSRMLLEVAAEVAELLLPSRSQLVDAVQNPWQPWLEASAQGPVPGR